MTQNLKKKYDTFNSEMQKAAKAIDIAKRFWTKCYVLIKPNFCPAIVAQVTLCQGKENHVHDGVKCYSSMDDIYKDHPDLVVSLKMFNTKNQIEKQTRRYQDTDLYPIYNQIPLNFNKLDDDLDVFATSERWDGFLGASECQIIVTPMVMA